MQAVVTACILQQRGNVLSIYEKVGNGAVTQTELNLYGSSRLGMQTALTVQPVVGSIDIDYTPLKTSTFTRGEKVYEITNHLGNVLATVSDQRQQHSTDNSTVDYYLASVITAQDYYPFGMLMPGRKGHSSVDGSGNYTWNDGNSGVAANLSYNQPRAMGDQAEYKATHQIEFMPGFMSGENGDSFIAYIVDGSGGSGSGSGPDDVVSGYRYGFNAKENDNDIQGEGDDIDFGARIYDSRLGRWLSVDPLFNKNLFESPYVYTSGNPIYYIDKDGGDKIECTRIITDKYTVVITKVTEHDFEARADARYDGGGYYLYKNNYTITTTIDLRKGVKADKRITQNRESNLTSSKEINLLEYLKIKMFGRDNALKIDYPQVMVYGSGTESGVIGSRADPTKPITTFDYSQFSDYMEWITAVMVEKYKHDPEKIAEIAKMKFDQKIYEITNNQNDEKSEKREPNKEYTISPDTYPAEFPSNWHIITVLTDKNGKVKDTLVYPSADDTKKQKYKVDTIPRKK